MGGGKPWRGAGSRNRVRPTAGARRPRPATGEGGRAGAERPGEEPAEEAEAPGVPELSQEREGGDVAPPLLRTASPSGPRPVAATSRVWRLSLTRGQTSTLGRPTVRPR